MAKADFRVRDTNGEADLFDPEIFAGKTATALSAITWVASHITDKKAKPDDAPNSAAWAMLSAVKGSNGAEGRFWTDLIDRIAGIGDLRPGHSPAGRS